MKNNQDKTNKYILLPGLMLITGLCHISALKNHLVADSWVFLVPRSFAETFGFFFKSIIPHEWEAFWLRPIPMFSFWMDNILWPGTEWGPHFTNVILHVLNVFLIWVLIQFIYSRSKSSGSNSGSRLPAIIACLVYGLHPLSTGAVAWVAARFDLMSLSFGLLGMLAWFKWEAGEKKLSGVFVICFIFMCAILSKEQSIIFPAICFAATLLRMTKDKINSGKYLNFLFFTGLSITLYFIYRVLVFNGLGGYVREGKGLNPVIPFKFLLALLFPLSNVTPDWTFSLSFFLTSAALIALIIFIYRTPRLSSGKVERKYLLCTAALFVLGLATTIPHAGMTLERIMGHSESRFTLMPIAGLSLVLGIGAINYIRSVKTYKLILIILLFCSIISSWRTTVQIQGWKNAGEIAYGIVSETIRIAPNPPQNSKILFYQIPVTNEQYAYIFGIGLKEAVLSKYPGRNDITVLGTAKRNDLNQVNPDRDFVFAYNREIGRLERLTPYSEE
ncbi:hypothetical protein ACFL6K_04875 [Candidatus Latescibacterota bacterium]